MEIKKIKEENYGLFMEKSLEDFDKNGEFEYMFSELENNTSLLRVNGQVINVDINLEEYKVIVKENDSQANKNIKLSLLLYRDFKNVPTNIMLDKYVWAYLNIKIFHNIISEHIIYFSKYGSPVTNVKDRIVRNLFSKVSKSRITRSGLRWLWYCAFILNGERDYIEKTLNNIDPIRAMFERSFSNDREVLKAYIDCIVKINKERKKQLNQKERNMVATHINCVGAVNRYATRDNDELITFLEEQVKYIIER